MIERLRVGDKVFTNTNGVFQLTQESLNGLTGAIQRIKDVNNIHVLIDKKPHFGGVIAFSETELTKIT